MSTIETDASAPAPAAEETPIPETPTSTSIPTEAPKRETKRGKILPRRTRSRKFKRQIPMAKPVAKEKISQSNSSYSHMNEIGRSPGLEMWKLVDEDTLEKIPRINHGSFQSDKAYIILSTTIKGGDYSDSDYDYQIHSWLGEKLPDRDKMTNSCLQKVAELELILEGKSVVTAAEVQNHESPLFLSYFKGTIKYVEPVKLKKLSDLNDQSKRTKLFHLKGRRNIRVKQVEVSFKSLNSGDVFILDSGDVIYQWNGGKANRMKKGKALDLTVRMRDERGARAKIVIIEETGDDDPDFWQAIGGKGPIAPPDEGGDDLENELAALNAIKLFRVNDCLGELEVEQVETHGQTLHTNMLDPLDCFILDCETEIFVWVGKDSSEKEKQGAMSNAREFLTQYKRPAWTPITKVSQGAESALFKDKFKRGDWNEYVESYEFKAKGIAKKQEQQQVNVDEMHHPEKYQLAKEEAREIIPDADEATGVLKLYYIENFQKFPLPEEEYGTFFNGECYLVSYVVRLPGGEESQIVYFWQGWRAGIDDKGSSALLARDLSGELGRNCIQVRVVQNKEPNHFLSHFKGRMIVRMGKRKEFKIGPDYEALFHIRGDSEVSTRAIQVDKNIKSFNTNDCFLLLTPSKRFVWSGRGATNTERDFAHKCGDLLIKDLDLVSVDYGKEPEEFWEALGGKGVIPEVPLFHKGKQASRLFQCSNATGVFKVFEIPNFTQEDLDDDDVMILDAVSEIHVWIGSQSNEGEKNMAMETAIKYIKMAPESRADNPIYIIQSGHEPPAFRSHFHAWDLMKAKERLKITQSGESVGYLRKLATLQTAEPNLFRMNSSIVLPKLTAEGELRTPETSSLPKLPSVNSASSPQPKPGPKFGGSMTALSSVGSGSSSGSSSPTPAAQNSARAKFATLGTPKKQGPPPLVEDEEGRALARLPVYTATRIRQKPIPDDIPVPEEIERHLSDEEFHEIFKMTRKQFDVLPKWKKTAVKKDKNIF